MNIIQEIRAQQDSILKRAKAKLDEIDDNMAPATVKEIHAAHDAAMDDFDRLEQIVEDCESEARRGQRYIDPDMKVPGWGAGVYDADLRAESGAPLGARETFESRAAAKLRKEGVYDEQARADLGALLRQAYGLKKLPGDERRLGAETRALSLVDAEGGFTVPTLVSARIIDALAEASLVTQLGAQRVPLEGKTNFARVDSIPAASFRAPSAAIAETDPVFSVASHDAQALAAIVRAPIELVEDASPNIEQALIRVIAAQVSETIDSAALRGDGVGANPTGITNTAGVNAIAHDAQLTNYAPFLAARGALMTAKADAPTGFVLSTREGETLAGLADTTGQPLNPPRALENVQMLESANVPINEGVGTNESTIVGGDFRRLMIGVRTDLRIQVLRERFADVGEIAFLVWHRISIALEQPAAFVKITGVLP